MKMAKWFRAHRHTGRRVLSGLLALVMTLGLAGVALPGVRARAEDGVASTDFLVTHVYLGDPVLIEEGWVDGEGNHDYTYTVEHDATPSISYYSEETQAYYIYPQPQSYLDESVGAPVTEEYSGYEIVDGNLAVNWIEPTGDGTGLDAGHFEIKYNAEVQTVRLYLFYSYNGMTVLGASFGAVFDGLTIDGVDVTGKDVLEVTDENREAIQAAITEKGTDTLKEADLTTVERIYNTDPGLHTEKRVSPDVLEDGRTFDVSLESWYTANSNMADVGFILDSSGSMAFVPTGALDAFEHGDDKAYGATVWDKGYGPYVSLPAECWTNPNWVFSGNTDNSPLAYTNYSYYVYDSRPSVNELVPLAYWDGEMDGTPNPLLNGLVGLYQFARSADGSDPDFLKNGVSSDGKATLVEASHHKTNGDYKLDNNTSDTEVTPYKGAFQAYDEGNKAHSILDLDAVADPNNFTLSFAVKTNGTGVINTEYSKDVGGEGPQAQDLVTIKNAATGEVLYTILRGTKGAGASQDHVRWVGNDSNTPVVDVKKVFAAKKDDHANYGGYTANNWRVFTFVVQDGHVTTYIDGTEATYTDGEKNIAEGDVTFDGATSLKFTLGGDDAFVSGPTLQIDEVYIYNRALSEDAGEITKLVDTMKNATGSVLKKENEEHALIGGNKMDLNQASQFVALPQEKRAGWYYVNSTSTYDTIETTGSAKSLHGLPASKDNFYPENMGYKDEALGKNVLYEPYSLKDCDYKKIDYHGFYTYEESGCEAVEGKEVALTAGDKIETASPCILYFGRATPDDYAKGFVGQKEGEAGELILRCIFSPTGGTVLDSPVLFKLDHNAALTKVQKLQVALNKFINRLQVDSPYSKVSAVRFSSDQYVRDDEAGTDREKELLLQTWTSDPKESTGMMSLNRGATETGMAKATDADGGLYNYVITGGTNAYTGLQAFSDYLAEAEDIKDDGASKYVILFTDGQDYELTEEGYSGNPTTTKAYTLAEELRGKGYTIFTVQLVSGDTASSGDDIPKFLEAITGDPKNCFTAKDADALDGAFNSIIEEMPFRLTGYSVRDYIDPRFDLVADTVTPSAGDAGVRTREIVHLHEGGTIHIGESDEASDHYDLTADGGHEFYFSTAEKNDTEGAEGETTYTERYTKATLKYDTAKGLYYLEWTNQSIPLCQEGSNRLSVWSATITLRAKEDFIGGNAILTNGPYTGENMVFHPDDETPSSGTDHADYEAARMPSKGFPRTQVNVKPYRMVTDPSVDVRYLGESMDPKEALSALLHNAEGEMRDLDHLNVTREEWDNRDGSGYYYEYIQRYLQKHPEKYDGTNLDEDFDAFLDDLLAGNKVELPYSFLPAVTGGGDHDHGTQTGGTAYEGDVLGAIAYQWAAVTDGDGPPDDDLTADPIDDTDPKRYQLTVTYTPDTVESHEPEEAKLVDDTAYATPKTPVGSVAVGDATQALHTTYVASGRLALKAQAPTATLQKIVDEGGALNVTVEKSVDPAAGIAAMDAGDPAATLPFALTQDALDAAPEVNGNKTVYFIATDTLPMGSYTLSLEEPEPGEFTDLKGADGADYTWARFDLTVDGVTVDSYFAGSTPDTNTVTFQLGDTNDETRTSAREGLADKLAAWVDDKIAAAIADAPDEDAKKELRTSQKTLNDLGLDPIWDGAAELPAYLNARLGMGEVYMTLTPPVEVTLTTAKTFENASQNDQPVRFTFTLTPEEEGADVLTATVAYDPSAGEETQTVTFDPLVFLRPGTYTYTLAEEQETVDRVTFDETAHEVQIAVSDSGVTVTVDGTAYAETKDTSEADSGSRYTFDLAPAIAFTNTYKPAVGALTIHKVVAGDGAPTSAETYTFEVSDGSSSQTVSIEGSGSRTLEGLTPGAYTVTELTSGESFTTTVDGVETDQAEVAVPLDGEAEVTFTNTYEKPDTPEPPTPATGKLTIHKVVTGDGAPNPDEVYTFEVSDGLDSQTVTIEGNGSAELELEPGAYTVTELTTGDFTTTVDGVEDKTAEVTVPENGEAEVTFTNTYEQTEPPTPATGKLTIRKVVINPPTPAETYAFEVSDGLDSQTVNIEGSGSAELELEPGTYTVTELTTGDFTTTVDDVEINQAEITVPENGEVEVTFTNTYEQTEPPTPATGKLTIRKAVVNPPTPAETYTFEISTDPVQTVTIEGSGSRTLDLEPGTYTVTELTSGDFTTTVDGAEVNQTEITVPESGEVEVTFTNTYEKAGPTTPPTPTTGKLTIRKVVAGDDKPTPAATYTFEISTDPVRTVTIEGSGSRTLDLEPGTYTVTELTTGESFTTTVDGVETAQAEVTVPLGDTAEVTFTNTYQQADTPATGDLTISKTVTGTAGDRSREWHFHLTLGDESIDGVYGDVTLAAGEADLTLAHGQSVTLTGLPAGVTYAVTEDEAGQNGYKTSSTGATGTIPRDGAASAAFVNAKPSVSTGSRPSVATGSSGQTTPAPSETPVPSETPAPDGTPIPSEPPVSGETPIPSEPPVSGETPVPTETPVPEETPVPSETPVPNGNTPTPIPEETPAPDETPKTGDDRHLGLWIALLLFSAVGAAVTLWPATWQKNRGGKGRRGRK